MKKIAFGFTVLLHPLLLLNFGLFTLFEFHPYYLSKFYDEQFLTISIFLAVNTLIMPLLSIYLLKRFNFIDGFEINDVKQRFIPYSIIAILLTFTTYQLYRNEVVGLPLLFLSSTIVCVVVNILFNIRFKISSHALASGGLLGLYVFLTIFEHLSVFNWLLIGSFFIAGISAWSRLYLNAHTELQVYSGFFVGLIIVLSVFVGFA